MMLFALYLEGSARDWYLDFPTRSIKNLDQLLEVFNKIWSTMKEGMQLLAKFQGDKKANNESVKDFIHRSDKLL